MAKPSPKPRTPRAAYSNAMLDGWVSCLKAAIRQSPRPGRRAKCSAWANAWAHRATAIEPDAII